MDKLQSFNIFASTGVQKFEAEMHIKTEPVESFDDDFNNLNSLLMNFHSQKLENPRDDFSHEACEADLVINKVQGFKREMNTEFLKTKASLHASELIGQVEITDEDKMKEQHRNIILGSDSSSICATANLSHLYPTSVSKIFVPLKCEEVESQKLESPTDVFGLEACEADLVIHKFKDFEWDLNTIVKTETTSHVAEITNEEDRMTEPLWNIPSSSCGTTVQNRLTEEHLPEALIPIKCDNITEHFDEWTSYKSEVMAEDTYVVGDLVWVYTKGHPLWPGIISCPQNEMIFSKLKYRSSNGNLSGPRQFHIQFFCYNYQTMWVSSTAIFLYKGLSYLTSYFDKLKLDIKSRKSSTSVERNLLKSFSKMTQLLIFQAKNRKALQWYQAVEEADQALAMERSERINLFKMILMKKFANTKNLETNIESRERQSMELDTKDLGSENHKLDNLEPRNDDVRENEDSNFYDNFVDENIYGQYNQDVKNIHGKSDDVKNINDQSIEVSIHEEEFSEDVKNISGESNEDLRKSSEKFNEEVNIHSYFDEGVKNDNEKFAVHNNQGNFNQNQPSNNVDDLIKRYSINELAPNLELDKSQFPRVVLRKLNAEDEKKIFVIKKENDCVNVANPSSSKKLTFARKKLLKSHLSALSDQQLFKCTECDAIFKHRFSLKRHLIYSHSTTKVFKCHECNYKCNYKYNLELHIRLHSNGKYYKCSECDYECNQKGSLKLHFLTHNKIFKCLECDFESNWRGTLQRHSLTHTNKLFKCVECNYECTQKGNLKLHSLTHTNEKLFKCLECDFKCKWKGNLQRHSLTHTNKKLFKCVECDYGCNKKGSLRLHSLTHTKEKFKCLECDYKCSRKDYLQRHSLTHTNARMFKCSECDYGCNQKYNLQLHSLTHSHQKLFRCPECDYKCNLKGTLKLHLLTHSDKKLFKCSECHYESNYKGNFKLHKLKHANTKLFKCADCDYECNHKGNFKTHSLRHSNIKLFKCSECDYKCKVKNSLTLHLLTHSNIKLFKCSGKDVSVNAIK